MFEYCVFDQGVLFCACIHSIEGSSLLSGLHNANAQCCVFGTNRGPERKGLAPREASKSQDIIAMRFSKASVLPRKSLNRNLFRGVPLGSLLLFHAL